MPAEVIITDETTSGEVHKRFVLRLASERITARELLERRIRREVKIYNRERPEIFEGLIRPSAAERVLNGSKRSTRKKIDAEKQITAACAAFRRNGFLMLVGDTQILELDEEVVLTGEIRVRFLRLVPLVGG